MMPGSAVRCNTEFAWNPILIITILDLTVMMVLHFTSLSTYGDNGRVIMKGSHSYVEASEVEAVSLQQDSNP